MTLLKETIGRRIAKARKDAKLTQAELAEMIGISEKYLSRVECGKQLPSIVIVMKICEVLYISADELLGKTNIYNSKVIQNEMNNFSAYEEECISEIIKIILTIKNHT